MSIIEVSHLSKRYGDQIAVAEVSFAVEEGEIFGIVGRNGAGKTTTVECVAGLRVPDGGEIAIDGLHPRRDRAEVTRRLGVQLQSAVLADKLKVAEAMRMFTSFYGHRVDPERLIKLVGLGGKRTAAFGSLSGGQRQRLSIALALAGDPRVAILDELTTGLDPQARRDMWELIEGVRDRGVTVVLVTHFMEEAERLCDRVALIDDGRVAALDTPTGLVRRAGLGERVSFRASEPFDDNLLKALPKVATVTTTGGRTTVTGDVDLAPAVIVTLAGHGIEVTGLRVEQPSLDEAFLALTYGHPAAA